MFDTYVTLVGNVVSDVRSATTVSGVPLATFRMAVSPRRFDRDTAQWTSGESTYYTVAAWRRLAEHTLSSVEKGDPVVVTGKLHAREWHRDDIRHTSVEVEATALGHDLTRGTAVFTRTRRRLPDGEPEWQPPGQAVTRADPRADPVRPTGHPDHADHRVRPTDDPVAFLPDPLDRSSERTSRPGAETGSPRARAA